MTSVPPAVRIAMWSGPRNISTAMLRSFGNRPDTSVIDEPFYAVYLKATGLDHPMRAEILASQPTDPADVVSQIMGRVPLDRPLWYQKHMTHHMVAGVDRSWIDRVANAFLLRAPEAVLASYVKRRAAVTLDDIGLPQQAELFDRVADRLGHAPPVLDAEDVLGDPPQALRHLCLACGVSFDERMLRWDAGPRSTDGVWAPAWYDQVIASTGFAAPRQATPAAEFDDTLKRVLEAARPYYERLSRHRMVIERSA